MSPAQVSHFPASPREGHPAVPTIPDVQKQTILDYLKAFGLASELTEPEKLQFIEISQAFGLNPFKREVHVAVYGEGEYRKLSIITGYEVYLKRADRTGKLDGWRAWVEGEGDAMKAFVEIHRKDWAEKFIHEVYWREAVQKKRDGSPTSFWSKQPRFQLKKVAISQGFRLAFPDELGGMPYDPAELPDSESATFPERSIPASITLVGMNPTPLAADPVSPATSPAGAAAAVEAVPEPEDDGERTNRLYDELCSILDHNEDAFTPKHQEWILAKARKAGTSDGVERMVAYARKVLRNAASMTTASA
ncbi:MAG: phage recombination protein Bet [Candidatus Paceibacterota bacterium]